jgi:hypothetical protein
MGGGCFFVFPLFMGVFFYMCLAFGNATYSVSIDKIKTFEPHNQVLMGLGPDKPVWAFPFMRIESLAQMRCCISVMHGELCHVLDWREKKGSSYLPL